MIAPRVTTPYVPGTHSDVSDGGRVDQRHENVPCWGSASCVGDVGSDAGVKDTGRYPSSARSCWSRSVDPGATLKCTVVVAASRWPWAPRTPPVPPGTISVSDVPGANGPSASNWTASGERGDQFPGTGGFNVGSGELGVSAVEKSTVTAVPGSTPVSPLPGSVPITVSGTMASVTSAPAAGGCERSWMA